MEIIETLDSIEASTDTLYYLAEITEKLTQQTELLTSINTLLFYGIIAIGVLMIFTCLWRFLKIFI